MTPDKKQKLQNLLAYLNANKDKPSVMADLRCALIPSREFRAWPHIAGNGFSLEADWERIPALVTAFAFACQPRTPATEDGKPKENMGDVLRKIACGDEGANGLTTFALRFKRILDCETQKELALQLKGVLLLTKTRDIPVDHWKLFRDIDQWGDSVRREWANHYFSLKKAKEKDGTGAEA